VVGNEDGRAGGGLRIGMEVAPLFWVGRRDAPEAAFGRRRWEAEIFSRCVITDSSTRSGQFTRSSSFCQLLSESEK
jgi:hypothetical protein